MILFRPTWIRLTNWSPKLIWIIHIKSTHCKDWQVNYTSATIQRLAENFLEKYYRPQFKFCEWLSGISGIKPYKKQLEKSAISCGVHRHWCSHNDLVALVKFQPLTNYAKWCIHQEKNSVRWCYANIRWNYTSDNRDVL